MPLKWTPLNLSSGAKREGTITWRSPSNIAIVKYWGKYGVQLPRNPNISFTLDNAFTETQLSYSVKDSFDGDINLTFLFEGKPNEAFKAKQITFLKLIVEFFPFLTQVNLKIESKNSFPHSAGIASSASSMSALALCLCSLEQQLRGGNEQQNTDAHFFRKASFIARLGSGSACRSVYPTMAVWGKCKGVKAATNDWAIPYESEIHPIFKQFQDTILIAGRSEKSVSSRMGHGLMEQNPYAKPRYQQANDRMLSLLSILKAGDVESFGQIAEDEALTLHALMMTSSPSFTLLKPNTLKMIEILRGWREATQLPCYFSLDAGPNLHLLYPENIKAAVHDLIQKSLKPLCENGEVIFDAVGKGPKQLI